MSKPNDFSILTECPCGEISFAIESDEPSKQPVFCPYCSAYLNEDDDDDRQWESNDGYDED